MNEKHMSLENTLHFFYSYYVGAIDTCKDINVSCTYQIISFVYKFVTLPI